MIRNRYTLALACAVLSAGLWAGLTANHATAQTVLRACYNPGLGLVYRIGLPDLPSECRGQKDVEFSWTDASGADHGSLAGLMDDDHVQYLRVDGIRALTGNLMAGGNKITGLAAATAAGDAVRFEQAVLDGAAAGGDLGGSFPMPAVTKIQGRPVSAADPTDGQVLKWDATANEWAPASVNGASSPFSGLTIVDNGGVIPLRAGWDDYLDISVDCPTGSMPINGGFRFIPLYGVPPSYFETRLVANGPTLGNEWRAKMAFRNTSTQIIYVDFKAYAVCVPVS